MSALFHGGLWRRVTTTRGRAEVVSYELVRDEQGPCEPGLCGCCSFRLASHDWNELLGCRDSCEATIAAESRPAPPPPAPSGANGVWPPPVAEIDL